TENCGNEATRLEIPMSMPASVVNKDNSDDGSSESRFSNNGTCAIRGRVLMQNTDNAVEGVLVSITNECNGSKQTSYTDPSGYYEFVVVEGCDYILEGSKSDLASQGKTVSKLNCENGGVTTDLYMFGAGDVVQIENIYFDYGKYNIRSDAREGINKLVKLMREYPSMTIEIASHTDSRSPVDFNQKLSEGRAKESAEYLVKRGISRSRLSYAGYGEARITNGCVDGVPCSNTQHQANRRTEFKITTMN
ncbi:MAG: outer membrane protein OmpA-like peptidoglycan-associated protein, partial [Arcticibacterium sp.]